jgi:hypothetical protein
VSDKYTTGGTYARRRTPRFEFKPSSTNYTGGGYARIRSTEYREHTPGTGADDVFVAVHRLAAVAWHLPDGTLGDDVHLSDMDGMDVHHTQPGRDERGMPSANGEAWTTLVSHGGHSEITQSEMRAWGEDAKREIERETVDRCVRCNDEYEMGCTSEDWKGVACHDCATTLSDGAPIEVV